MFLRVVEYLAAVWLLYLGVRWVWRKLNSYRLEEKAKAEAEAKRASVDERLAKVVDIRDVHSKIKDVNLKEVKEQQKTIDEFDDVFKKEE